MAEQVAAAIELDVSDVASMLRLHPQSVKKIPAKELPFTRINKRGDRRYARADVEAYLAARREE
jgi:hypothetical protein